MLLVLFVFCMMFGSSVMAAGLDRGMVTFTFDDGLGSLVTAAGIMDKYNLSGTAFIITGRIGDAENVSWDQIRDLHWKGWEVGNHTVDHTDLTTMTRDEAVDKITGARGDFVANGITDVSSFASPFGAYDATVIDILQKIGYTANRQAYVGDNWDNPFNSPGDFDQWNIKVISIRSDTSLTEIKNWLSWAAGDHVWVVFVIHNVVKTLSGDDYEVSTKTFQKMIIQVNSMRLKGQLDVVTLKMGTDKMNWLKGH